MHSYSRKKTAVGYNKKEEDKSKLNSECEEICKSKRVCEDTPVNYELGEAYDIPIPNSQGNYCDCRCISRYPVPSVLLTGKLQGELGQLEKPREVKVTPKETKEQEIERIVQGCEKPINCNGVDCRDIERDKCYQYIAVKTSNLSWCNEFRHIDRINHCVYVVALSTKNASICETEIGMGQSRDRCIQIVNEGYAYQENMQFEKENDANRYWKERFK